MYRCCCLLLIAWGSFAFAGGFDQSGRPSEIIFGDTNALKLDVKYIYPQIDLHVQRARGQGADLPELAVEEITEPYTDALLGVRWQVSDALTCAVQLEQPFRFDTQYPDDRLSYQADGRDARTRIPAPLRSAYRSRSATLACRIGLMFDHQSETFSRSRLSLIAGPKYQTIEGRFSSDLSDFGEAEADNYRAHLRGSGEWAYLLGLAYEIPELAFRLSLFLHNEIEHQLRGEASAPSPDLSTTLTEDLRAETLTPKTIVLNLQSGIAEDWLAYLNLRWGDWSSVDEIVVDAGPLSQRLEMFAHDTLNYELGLAVRMNSRLNLGAQFASFVDLDPAPLPDGLSGTNLRNPQAERYSLAFGGNYALTEALRLGLSASYFFLQHGRFFDTAYTVRLETSHAFVFSGTLQYTF